MGCRAIPYWVGNFLFDLTILIFFNIFFFVFAFTFPYIYPDHFNLNVITGVIPNWLFLLLFLNLTCITLSYILQFRFEKTSSA